MGERNRSCEENAWEKGTGVARRMRWNEEQGGATRLRGRRCREEDTSEEKQGARVWHGGEHRMGEWCASDVDHPFLVSWSCALI